jgi:hypothetical protein
LEIIMKTVIRAVANGEYVWRGREAQGRVRKRKVNREGRDKEEGSRARRKKGGWRRKKKKVDSRNPTVSVVTSN